MTMSPSAWTYAISFNRTRTTGVVTVTATAPEPAGVTTAILVSLSTMNEVADTLPDRLPRSRELQLSAAGRIFSEGKPRRQV